MRKRSLVLLSVVLSLGTVLAMSATAFALPAIPSGIRAWQGLGNLNATTTANRANLAQRYMHHTGRLALSGVDGIYGSGSKSAMKLTQKDLGLTQDGIVGPNTWRAMQQKCRWNPAEGHDTILNGIWVHLGGSVYINGTTYMFCTVDMETGYTWAYHKSGAPAMVWR